MLIILQLNEIEVELRTTKVPAKADGTLIRLKLDADQLTSKTWDATGKISENKVASFSYQVQILKVWESNHI